MKTMRVATEPIDMKEVATFIYGIFNALASGVLSAFCIFGHVYFSRELKDSTENLRVAAINVREETYNNVRKEASYTVNMGIMLIISLLALVIVMVWFSSSVMLIIGVNKKKAAYVKFFFIYMLSLCTVGVIAAVILMSYPWVKDNYLIASYIFIGTILYSLPLLCVYDTFKRYESGMAQLFDKKKLVEA